jgi:hypothetical protein
MALPVEHGHRLGVDGGAAMTRRKPAGTKRQFDQLVRTLANLRTTDRLAYLALYRTVMRMKAKPAAELEAA